MYRLVLITIVAVAILTGCGEADSSRDESATTITTQEGSTRQTDTSGRPLPFTTGFEKRWNSSNDGTDYEPCTAVDSSTAESVGLDIHTVADAATVDGQTLRGCTWEYSNPALDGWSADQIVADYESLEAYRLRNASFNWLSDIQISGRTIGIGSLSSNDCFTYVQSEGSGVITAAAFNSSPNPPLPEICDRAIELTRATIADIPA
ncbi:DUF3558 family protein [Gordonia sesuvii]|uniref:DUF3558 family protein n=1 Tax=Gordonia sesuvii TaxID=3116777 RepID=UPI003D66A2E9